MINKIKKQALVVFLLVISWSSFALNVNDYNQLRGVINQLVEEKVYTRAELEVLFSKVSINRSVLEAMKNPAESKLTWGKYRNIFLQNERIDSAMAFWKKHEETLEQVEKQYGVPIPIILSILGVESKYGQHKGKYKVLESLTTLSTHFERRSQFFTAELKQFLILCKQSQLDALSILGSYAGAMGYGQFISSSYLNYGVDFNGNNKVDLMTEPEDAIASVANYLEKNGWQRNKKVVSKFTYEVSDEAQQLANRQRKLKYDIATLKTHGLLFDDTLADEEKVNFLRLNANPVVPPSNKLRHYIVRAGDTACEIAQRHNISCRALKKKNRLNKRGDIFRDQKLILPLSSIKMSQKERQDYQEVPVYFITHHNFYVITRYNISVLYAMAVHDLAQAIQSKRAKQQLSNTQGNQ